MSATRSGMWLETQMVTVDTLPLHSNDVLQGMFVNQVYTYVTSTYDGGMIVIQYVECIFLLLTYGLLLPSLPTLFHFISSSDPLSLLLSLLLSLILSISSSSPPSPLLCFSLLLSPPRSLSPFPSPSSSCHFLPVMCSVVSFNAHLGNTSHELIFLYPSPLAMSYNQVGDLYPASKYYKNLWYLLSANNIQSFSACG